MKLEMLLKVDREDIIFVSSWWSYLFMFRYDQSQRRKNIFLAIDLARVSSWLEHARSYYKRSDVWQDLYARETVFNSKNIHTGVECIDELTRIT